MKCPECFKEIELKRLRQCNQGEDCLEILCEKCIEIHEMDHRHNDEERKSNKYIDAGMDYMNSLMFRRLPVAMLLMFMVTGTTIIIDIGMDGEHLIDFSLPEIGRKGAFLGLFILLPNQLTTLPFKYILRFISPIIPEFILNKLSPKDKK